MKKQIMITLTAFLMAGFQTLHAQKNLIQLTPLPFTGKPSFQYHRVVSKHQTITAEWQIWNAKRKNNSALFLLGVFASSTDEVTVKGNRFQIGTRLYAAEAMRGLFVEGGVHWGKFDIKRKEESETASIWGFWTGNFGSIETKITRLENVKAYGAKLGGGFQKRKGAFSLDFSLGAELNAAHSGNISALTRMLDSGRPYARMSMGVVF